MLLKIVHFYHFTLCYTVILLYLNLNLNLNIVHKTEILLTICWEESPRVFLCRLYLLVNLKRWFSFYVRQFHHARPFNSVITLLLKEH